MRNLLVALSAFFLLMSASAQMTSPASRPLDESEKLLRKLSEAPGPPGAEDAVRKIMIDEMTPLASKPVRFDGIGSVIEQQGTTGPSIMIDAHMDELGGMIKRITPEGYLRVQWLGGWLDQTLLDQRWVIIGSKGPVRAFTEDRDTHLTPLIDRQTMITRDHLLLDVGAKSAEEVTALGIRTGDPIVPDSSFEVLNQSRLYLGKAWDDRVGLAVMIEAMRRLSKLPHPNKLFWVSTVQEEQGLRGARPSSTIVKPDIGIALESGLAGDGPLNKPEDSPEKLGSGPGMMLWDVQTVGSRKLIEYIRKIAAQKHIPLQEDVQALFGADSFEMQTTNEGAPAVVLLVPVRSTHAHNGLISRDDYDQMIDLLVSVLQSLDEATVRSLRDYSH
jgi:putative aminopeptidase FrvX